MSQIIENLWLGPIDLVHDFDFLTENNITHVLSIIDLKVNVADPSINQLSINLYDHEEAPIQKHFATCVSFIKEALTCGGAVYVHCFAGISRSPTIVAAYLIATRNLSSKDALALIQKQRPIIDPNNGFRAALEAWASKCAAP